MKSTSKSKSKIKSLLIVLLAAVVAVAMLTACGSISDASSSSESSRSAAKKKTGKVLVVCFSAQGHTRKVAKAIAKQTGAKTFFIHPKKKYTESDLDYNDDSSRVNKEHADESLQNVALKSTKVKNWKSYKTVFIGYPIWFGDAAWPINGFVKANDFTGKTVIPFCTSGATGISASSRHLARLAGTGKWKTGVRFSSDVSASSVKAKIKSMGY